MDYVEETDMVAIGRDLIPFRGIILDTNYINRVAFALQAEDGGRLVLLAGEGEDLKRIAQYESDTAFTVDLITVYLPRFICPLIFRHDSDAVCMLYVVRYQLQTHPLTFGLQVLNERIDRNTGASPVRAGDDEPHRSPTTLPLHF